MCSCFISYNSTPYGSRLYRLQRETSVLKSHEEQNCKVLHDDEGIPSENVCIPHNKCQITI